ncbi:PREDICTED: fibrillin-1-like [Acropora digitifera]|uniref:fibrillin-1-like n=1 Tax=Acropora digitifera TaxID=70779 RepID=UPI00077A0415|nr:PREDICTED: fibrillin-1-like [Acropora digitifera]
MSKARIGDNVGWCPSASDVSPYLQFDLEKLYLICGFQVIQGSLTYMSSYRVHVSPEEDYLNSWNIYKPEFYALKYEDMRAYQQARVRKLGRYVRIFPHFKHSSWKNCIRVEIFGQPYIQIYQDVFFIHDVKVRSYKKGRPTKFFGSEITVEEYKHPHRLSRIDGGLTHYTEVVPSRIPWKEELSVDTCVISPNPVKGQKDFLSGRVDKVDEGKNEYDVEYLAKGGFMRARFKREQLQVVYGAWCKVMAMVYLDFNIDQGGLIQGDIVQIDSKASFRNRDPSKGIQPFPLAYRDEVCQVNQEKVVVEKLRRDQDLLYFVDSYRLKMAVFVKYYEDSGYLLLASPSSSMHWKKQLNEVYYNYSCSGIRRCGKNETNCWESRLPFSDVTRWNCSYSTVWGDRYCVDEDECQTGMATCAYRNADCENRSYLRYSCYCPKGTTSHSDRVPCFDEDECNDREDRCGEPESGSCINTFRSYRCECNQGFQIDDSFSCGDIDECQLPTIKGNCTYYNNTFCKNSYGSFECLCKPGYQGEYNNCTDEDECGSGRHNCSSHADCINSVGSYVCKCKLGFTGDGRRQNGCVLRNDTIECVNTSGSSMCACREGFTGDGKRCTNIDECKTSAHDCVKNAICIDRDGSYSCKCRFGFYGNATEKCIDIDECSSSDENKCSNNATCINNNGSYECRCKGGFDGDGFNCQDFDECSSSDENKCSKYATCINTHASYECRCKKGFAGDGINCQDFDECSSSDENKCLKYATCINTHGSYECRCKKGFDGDGFNCQDIDECSSSDENKCLKYATCINNHGSYECLCKKGFDGDGFSCQDIDECSGKKACSSIANARCKNTPGSFRCECNQGFEGGGPNKNCSDIDECSNEDYPCAEQATCVNNEGGFECVCPEGYVGDGKDYCTVNSSPSTKTGYVWISSLAMVILSLFRAMI